MNLSDSEPRVANAMPSPGETMSKRMNYNRPQFRLQGRQVEQIGQDTHAGARWLEHQEAEQRREKKKQKRQRKRGQLLAQSVTPPTNADILAMIERDVREIATAEFFNTTETIQAEVQRRFAGIEHTRSIMAALPRGGGTKT